MQKNNQWLDEILENAISFLEKCTKKPDNTLFNSQKIIVKEETTAAILSKLESIEQEAERKAQVRCAAELSVLDQEIMGLKAKEQEAYQRGQSDYALEIAT